MWMDIRKAEDGEKVKRWYQNNGGFKRFCSEVKRVLNIESNTFKSWDGIIKFLVRFNQTFQLRKAENTAYDDLYFKDKASKYIFALSELDGEKRAEILGITKEHYSNLKLAKSWKRDIVKVIHPDNCPHIEAEQAMSKLNNMYERMIKYAK